MAIQAPHMSSFSDNLGFALQEQQQQQQPLMQQQQFHNLSHHHLQKYHKNVIDFQPPYSANIQSRHTMEMDRFINIQNERLRMALQEQRKQQISQLRKKYESKAQIILIKEKEEEIIKASKRTMELQDCLGRMEMENQTWQRVAKEKESMVESLNSAIIERLRAAEDAESICCINIEEEDKTRRKMKMMICRCCNSRNSCVIMLPCRHLCSCTNCDSVLDSCPVCNVIKKASIQAFI